MHGLRSKHAIACTKHMLEPVNHHCASTCLPRSCQLPYTTGLEHFVVVFFVIVIRMNLSHSVLIEMPYLIIHNVSYFAIVASSFGVKRWGTWQVRATLYLHKHTVMQLS